MLPPSIVFDDKLNVLQVINDINPFVELRSGQFNQTLSNIFSPEMMVVANNLIRKVKAQNQPVIFQGVSLTGNEKSFKTDIKGQILTEDDERVVMILSFTNTEKSDLGRKTVEVVNQEAQIRDQVSELQYELQFTKESLQATVEELETSNEELQASNEELIASNEELQSTNEELQSVNEELFTVNSEYQSKIEELTQLNSDVNNLLNNTDIAALYLDSRLCIRKFTPCFANISKLVEYDLGRPLNELATAFVYPEFLADISRVQLKLQPIEKEVVAGANVLYLLRIVPYRTDYNAVDGILVTMVNITGLQDEREKLKVSNARLQAALEMGNMAWWEWDIPSGNVTMHDKKATMLGYSPEEFPKNVYKICELIHPEDYQKTMDAMRDHLMGKLPLYDVKYRIKTKAGGYKWYWDKGGIVDRTPDNKPLKLVGLVIDISENFDHTRFNHP